jgi:hypothetical protein
LDERVRRKTIKETGVSGGPKGVGHFLFFKRKTGNQDSKQFQYENISSTRPAWYGTLLRHPDRDLQAVFVDSRTFVRPLSKARQRDSRQSTVILQGACKSGVSVNLDVRPDTVEDSQEELGDIHRHLQREREIQERMRHLREIHRQEQQRRERERQRHEEWVNSMDLLPRMS